MGNGTSTFGSNFKSTEIRFLGVPRAPTISLYTGKLLTKMMRQTLSLILLLMISTASADNLILVQGYLGDANTWHNFEVTPVLEKAGWVKGGHLYAVNGTVAMRPGRIRGNHRYYTISLPTEAPLLIQARYLAAYVEFLNTHAPDTSLILAGHSAGGVVSRLFMVQHPNTGVDALITFASPHLGTNTAELGAAAGRTPLAFLAPLLGGQTLNRSQGLYHDLSREQNGNILFWLNRQAHPTALYVSVIRHDGGLLDLGDLVVPTWSQDLNQVHALRGRAISIPSEGGHLLKAEDGHLLLKILRMLHTT